MHSNVVTKKVIASVFEKDGRFLIAQRAKKDALYGKWEFPGGKVEEGETFQECLKRELFEEFGIVAQIGVYMCSSFFVHKNNPMEMLAFRILSYEGDFELREHQQIAWVLPHEFKNYDFPEPDLPIIEKILQEKHGKQIATAI